MKSRKPALTARDLALLMLLALGALMLLSVLIGVNVAASRVLRGGGELFSPWLGARAFLWSHGNPYGLDVAQQAEQLDYGRAPRPGENPDLLTLPFYLLPVYFPLALVSDPAVARAIWLCLSEAALLAAALLTLRLIDWRPHSFFLVAFCLLFVSSFYSISALLQGSTLVLLGLAYVAILAALQDSQDELAGALLALTWWQWQAGGLFLLLVLWRLVSGKRTRVLLGFGMSLAVLLISSFLLDPGWLIPFLQSVRGSLQADYGLSTTAILASWWPAFGFQAARLLAAGLLLVLGFEWNSARKADERHFAWAGCLTLAATPLLGFRSEAAQLVVLLPGLALIFAAATERWRIHYGLTALLWLIVFWLPWGLFTRAVYFQNPIYTQLVFLFLPVFSVAGLYWTRWWFMRPPRTWLDYVRNVN